jgi:polar amino acid transport system permease protein
MAGRDPGHSLMSNTSPSLPPSPTPLSWCAVAFAVLSLMAAIAATALIRAALESLGASQFLFDFLMGAAVLGAALLILPAMKAVRLAQKSSAARLAHDAVETRIAAAAAREQAQITFGWGAFVLLVLGFFVFIFMNDVAVGKTFINWPIIRDKWWPVVEKFFSVNVFMFVTAEILVLIWGLIVALMRMIPGAAGKPVRFLATLYCDVFRGLPGIVTLYLIGFGIPTSGIPDLFVPQIYGLFVDTTTMTALELKQATRIPVLWWCILALTLTYGAYVAEVYRSGIESIHWSQVSASRSLGLSFLQTMRHVIVPQAIRRIMAPLLNDFIGLQKDTALVQVVGVVDSFSQSKIIAANSFNLSAVTVVAILFVLITIPQARLVDWLAERDAQRMKAGG